MSNTLKSDSATGANRWTIISSLIVSAVVLASTSAAETVDILDISVPVDQNKVLQMMDSLAPVADEVCMGKAFGTYAHPTDTACYIVCYGSGSPSEMTDSLGHQRCCAEGLCYSFPSADVPAACGTCARQQKPSYVSLPRGLSCTCLSSG
jgi:hypothetical protein